MVAPGVLADAGQGVALERALAEIEILRSENAAVRTENGRLRQAVAARDAELERAGADLLEVTARLQELAGEVAVLKRMLFGRSPEKAARPGGGGAAPAGSAGGAGSAGSGGKRRGKSGNQRRDYSHLPRIEVIWDFGDGQYCCEQCGALFSLLGDDVSRQAGWQVLVRLIVHRRRRYKRACGCAGPKTVTAPGPPKAIGKGLLASAFTAMVLCERYVAGRSQNSLITGLARCGAELAPGTVAGTVKAAGALLAPLEEAICARNRASWHLHADETTWHVFTPAGGDGPARWWLWVFLGPDTTCFVMDPSRAAAVLTRHAGIGEDGQLAGCGEDGGPRALVISSDFYSVYTPAGKKAGGLVNLFCWAHIRRHFARAGDASPAQLKRWTGQWLERIKDLYAAHDQLMAAWNAAAAAAPGQESAAAAAMEKAYAAWDKTLAAIDGARKHQVTAAGLQPSARKALATLDREWDGLAAHRDYPMIGLDNNPAERAIRKPVVTRKNARGSRDGNAARLAATVWTVTATAEMAGLNPVTYLTAYLDACGRNSGKPPTGPDLEHFLPWTADPAGLQTWKQPPRPG